MRLITLGELVKDHISYRYPDKKVLAVFLNTTDDASKFVRENFHEVMAGFDPREYIYH